MRWQEVWGEKKPIFEMSIEEKEFVLPPLPVGAESDQAVKLHPFEAEAEWKSRAELGKLPEAFILAFLDSSVCSKPRAIVL